MPDPWLVRHAATAWTGRRLCGRSDPPLNDAGLVAASRVAAELAAILPAGIRIVTSPSGRARETAAAIAAAVPPASIEIDARWAEVDFGLAEGLTYEELERRHPEIARDLLAGIVEIDWPGGEEAASLVARVDGARRDLSERDGVTLVVSHGGPLRVAIGLATGQDPRLVEVPGPASIWRPPQASALSSAGRSRVAATGSSQDG